MWNQPITLRDWVHFGVFNFFLEQITPAVLFCLVWILNIVLGWFVLRKIDLNVDNINCFSFLYKYIANVDISLVIMQKGESRNGCFKKTKHAKFSGKQTFLTPWYVSGGKKCLFSGKFGVLCFLETPVLRSVLLPY